MKKIDYQPDPVLRARNEALREWLNSHDLLNAAALCRRVDYNRGAYSHFIEGHHYLSLQMIIKFENVLSNYGYQIQL